MTSSNDVQKTNTRYCDTRMGGQIKARVEHKKGNVLLHVVMETHVSHKDISEKRKSSK